MILFMNRYFNLMLVLALSALPGAIHAAQHCRSQTEIPASTPTARFIDQGDTVVDTGTGLMWSKCSAGLSDRNCLTGRATTHSWQEALNLASASTLSGHSDWRLPNINELRSIVEEQCYAPAINLSVFPNTARMSFWSASPYANNSRIAWIVNFDYGYSGDSGYSTYAYRSSPGHVRLVRGGK